MFVVARRTVAVAIVRFFGWCALVEVVGSRSGESDGTNEPMLFETG